MDNSSFDPLEWIDFPARRTRNTSLPQEEGTAPTASVEQIARAARPVDRHDMYAEVEEVVKQIEARKLDITAAYQHWRNIGFALADALGEDGRALFHRISRFYARYSHDACERQFNQCLRSKGQGISLKSFFYYAQKAGIPIGNPQTTAQQVPADIPQLPDELFNKLPTFLQRVVHKATSKQEKDLLLLGSLATLSACLTKLYGIYDGRKVHPNLFLFITAQASAGKGRLVHCRQLVAPIHKHMRQEATVLKEQYEVEMAAYNAHQGKNTKVKKPTKPPEKMLFLPANNSATGAYQLLGSGDGCGLIFETEGDTLAHAFKSDYGNYSDGFRKAFHHETISYYRRMDREYVDIEMPCLSAVLSGTPKQVLALIPSAESGLLSRFIFYCMHVSPAWKDVFAHRDDQGLDNYFDALGLEFYAFYQRLVDSPAIQFRFTPSQQAAFNEFFAQTQAQYLIEQGLEYMATVRRLGLVTFRISMILTALRMLESGAISGQLTCSEVDFQAALSIGSVLNKHAAKVFSELPEVGAHQRSPNRKEAFLARLPHSFTRQAYLTLAKQLHLPEKTAEGYITEFSKIGWIRRAQHGQYVKVILQESEASANPETLRI